MAGEIVPNFFVNLATASGFESMSVRVKTPPGVSDPDLPQPFQNRIPGIV